MRKLYKASVIILLVLIILATLAVGLLYGAYELYIKPKPADFEFSQTVDESTTVEIIRVNKVSDTELELVPLKAVTDTDAFLKDFGELECTVGISFEALATFGELESLDAIKITYADGNFDVITPYGNIDSTIFTPDVTLEMLLNERYFFFDADEFGALIDKYSE